MECIKDERRSGDFLRRLQAKMTFHMSDDDITHPHPHPPEQKTVGRILYGFSLLKCTVSASFARTRRGRVKESCDSRNVAFRRHPKG